MKTSRDALSDRGFQVRPKPLPQPPEPKVVHITTPAVAPAPAVHVSVPEAAPMPAPIVNVPAPQVHVSPITGSEFAEIAEALRTSIPAAIKAATKTPGKRPTGMKMSVKRDHRGLIESADFTFRYD